jgi:hypothetical protein
MGVHPCCHGQRDPNEHEHYSHKMNQVGRGTTESLDFVTGELNGKHTKKFSIIVSSLTQYARNTSVVSLFF